MASGEGIPGLADKLNHLFATVPAPTKSGRYSNDTAAEALAAYGVTVSGVHLSHLRASRRDNPSARLLAALADGDLAGIAANLGNDLQPAALALAPTLHDTLAAGRTAGALAGIVSGSGPTCAFLCADAADAERVAELVNDADVCREAFATTGPAPGPQVHSVEWSG